MTKVEIETATLYHGDCRELLSELTADVTVTDPPYGVNLGKHLAARDRRPGRVLVKDGYESYDDTPENFDAVVVPTIKWAAENSERSAVFCAVPSAWRLPTPDAIGGVYTPSGCGRSKWGFSCYAPVWFYGQAPDLQHGAYPTSFYSVDSADPNGHPCPKPLSWMLWLVNLASRSGEIVVDPFMGSGTTGVACADLGRRFVGIELERKYFDIACERISAAYAQQRLFA